MALTKKLSSGLVALVLASSLGFSIAEARKHPIKRKPHVTQVSKAPQNNIKDDTLTLYYQTNSDTVHNNDLKDLRKFISRYSPSTELTIEGHCDPRGSDDFNEELGRKRAQGVAGLINPNYQNINVSSYGETKLANTKNTFEALAQNRRVVIIAKKPPITRALELLSADYYLVDASDSMQGEKWKAVSSHNYPKGSSQYVFNDCNRKTLRKVKSLREITPACGTPLWQSTFELLKQMPEGKTLTILSDGEDNAGLQGYNTVIGLAKGKNIQVSTIGVGVQEPFKSALEDIANQTGGKFYTTNPYQR